MRKLRNLAGAMFVLVLMLAISSCGKKEGKTPEPTQEPVPDVEYETGNVTAFCVDEQGQIYTCEEGKDTICVYDGEGTKLREIAVEGGAVNNYTVMCAGEGVLYASDSEEKGITEIDITSGKITIVYQSEDPSFWSLFDMTVCNGKLYFMYQRSVDYAEMQLKTDYTAGYEYKGEQVMCLDTETSRVEEVEVPGVKRLCKKSNTELLFFAYEEDTGFSYLVYDTETGDFKDSYEANQENDLRYSAVMTYDNVSEKLLYPDSASGRLRALDITKKGTQADFYSTGLSFFGPHSLQCVNGCTYFMLDGKVKRIDNRSYIKKTEPLKIYSADRASLPADVLGYQVNLEVLDAEELATKLLAGDSDFDLLILSNGYDLSRQIERTGAYTPLNGNEKIEAYFDSCFDYIEEAATADNGALWMFPYEIGTQVLVYQPELCEKYGIDFSGELTYGEFLEGWEILENAVETESIKIEVQTLWWTVLQQYMVNYAVVDGEAQFDTELFREFAPMLKEMQERKFFYGEGPDLDGVTTLEQLKESVRSLFESYAFKVLDQWTIDSEVGWNSYVDNLRYSARIYDFDFFEARSMPSIKAGEEQKSDVDVIFYVVNPNSERKEEALGYLETLAETMTENESIYRTKELKGEYNDLQRQVHEVYENGKVLFMYPAGVIDDEYMRYIEGEIELEELIQEAERKFNIYLKE